MGQTRVRKTSKRSGVSEHGEATSSRDRPRPTHNELEPTSIESSNSTEIQPIRSRLADDIKPSLLSQYLIHDPTLIEIRSTPSKGVALFAAKKISAGTLVLAELPLVRLTRSQEADGTADAVLESSFNALSHPHQKAYLKLCDSEKADFSRVKSIYYSNCYNLTSKSSRGGSCIGMTASRINHSCVPNVQFSFDDGESGTMLFYAVRTISRGKEICSNYDSVLRLRAPRLQRQMMYYGFRCDCEACEAPNEFWSRSDERRQKITSIQREVKDLDIIREGGGEDARSRETAKKAMDLLQQLEMFYHKEGLVGVEMVNTYRSLARWADRLEDGKDTSKWLERELSLSIMCFGVSSVRVKQLVQRLQDMEK